MPTVTVAGMSNDGALRRPLVLTGGPAVGKTATGRWLAGQRPRAAYLDVDDLRQLVVAGAEAPWRGQEGPRSACSAPSTRARSPGTSGPPVSTW